MSSTPDNRRKRSAEGLGKTPPPTKQARVEDSNKNLQSDGNRPASQISREPAKDNFAGLRGADGTVDIHAWSKEAKGISDKNLNFLAAQSQDHCSKIDVAVLKDCKVEAGTNRILKSDGEVLKFSFLCVGGNFNNAKSGNAQPVEWTTPGGCPAQIKFTQRIGSKATWFTKESDEGTIYKTITFGEKKVHQAVWSVNGAWIHDRQALEDMIERLGKFCQDTYKRHIYQKPSLGGSMFPEVQRSLFIPKSQTYDTGFVPTEDAYGLSAMAPEYKWNAQPPVELVLGNQCGATKWADIHLIHNIAYELVVIPQVYLTERAQTRKVGFNLQIDNFRVYGKRTYEGQADVDKTPVKIKNDRQVITFDDI